MHESCIAGSWIFWEMLINHKIWEALVCWLIYWQKRIFSNAILLSNFKILFVEKSELEWNSWYLKFMIHNAFIWIIITLLYNCINIVSPINTCFTSIEFNYNAFHLWLDQSCQCKNLSILTPRYILLSLWI